MFRKIFEPQPPRVLVFNMLKQLKHFEDLCTQLSTLPQSTPSKRAIDQNYIKALTTAQTRLNQIIEPSPNARLSSRFNSSE